MADKELDGLCSRNTIYSTVIVHVTFDSFQRC